MVELPKVVLGTTQVKIYTNDRDEFQEIRSILLANNSSTPVQVWLAFVDRNVEDPAVALAAGYILPGTPFDPREVFQLPNKIIKKGDFIMAWASVANTVSFHADVVTFVKP